MSDFLGNCAQRLLDGEEGSTVMEAMRERYTTVRSLSSKVSLVRSMCTPSPAFKDAVEKETIALPSPSRDDFRSRAFSRYRRGGGDDQQVDAPVAEALQRLPPRMLPNVRSFKVTRGEMLSCKRAGAQSARAKNEHCLCLAAGQLLDGARCVLERAEEYTVCEIALSLLLATGRRQCEILNGRSTLDAFLEHGLRFEGQAKQRGDQGGKNRIIVSLLESSLVIHAFHVLRSKQQHAVLTNTQTSLRYQSALCRSLHAHPFLSPCRKVHALRGVYACLCLRLFEWGDASDAFVTMQLLGHAGIQESLVYTAVRLTDNEGWTRKDDLRLRKAVLEGEEVSPSSPQSP
jgi:integrase